MRTPLWMLFCWILMMLGIAMLGTLASNFGLASGGLSGFSAWAFDAQAGDLSSEGTAAAFFALLALIFGGAGLACTAPFTIREGRRTH